MCIRDSPYSSPGVLGRSGTAWAGVCGAFRFWRNPCHARCPLSLWNPPGDFTLAALGSRGVLASSTFPLSSSASDGLSGEESEADTSPPDSPAEAEEESGRVELARTPREPRAAKVKSPGGFHRGQRAWQGFRQKRKIPQTPAQAVPLLPKTPGEEYGTPRVAELNAWEMEEALVGGGGGALGASGKVVERRVSLGDGEKGATAPVSAATLPRPARRGGKRSGLRSGKTRGMPDHNPAGASQGTAPWL